MDDSSSEDSEYADNQEQVDNGEIEEFEGVGLLQRVIIQHVEVDRYVWDQKETQHTTDNVKSFFINLSKELLIEHHIRMDWKDVKKKWDNMRKSFSRVHSKGKTNYYLYKFLTFLIPALKNNQVKYERKVGPQANTHLSQFCSPQCESSAVVGKKPKNVSSSRKTSSFKSKTVKPGVKRENSSNTKDSKVAYAISKTFTKQESQNAGMKREATDNKQAIKSKECKVDVNLKSKVVIAEFLKLPIEKQIACFIEFLSIFKKYKKKLP